MQASVTMQNTALHQLDTAAHNCVQAVRANLLLMNYSIIDNGAIHLRDFVPAGQQLNYDFINRHYRLIIHLTQIYKNIIKDVIDVFENQVDASTSATDKAQLSYLRDRPDKCEKYVDRVADTPSGITAMTPLDKTIIKIYHFYRDVQIFTDFYMLKKKAKTLYKLLFIQATTKKDANALALCLGQLFAQTHDSGLQLEKLSLNNVIYFKTKIGLYTPQLFLQQTRSVLKKRPLPISLRKKELAEFNITLSRQKWTTHASLIRTFMKVLENTYKAHMQKPSDYLNLHIHATISLIED